MTQAPSRVAAFASLLVLVAIACGGATTRAVQVFVLIGLGLLWFLAPARRTPSRGFVVCAAGLIVLALMAWLPASWFAVEPWRRGLLSLGIPLGSTLSPQPWLSAEAGLWLIIGLAWVAWLLGQSWTASARGVAMRVLASGIVLTAAVALTARAFHFSMPGWRSDNGFGPFPNRNHTGHVLALGGMLAFGCVADAWRRDWRKALPWLIGVMVILFALVVNYSRGGLLLFFGAVVLWSALEAWRRKSWKTLGVGASIVLVLISLVLIAGGAFAGRFAGGADSQIAFRVWIWRDTLALIHVSPWCGIGLGNFTALFPFYRHASLNQQSVLHPESDWLLLAAELGWVGVALALGAAFFILREAFPFAAGSHRHLRGAAFAAAIAALVHGAIDVPGHRVGSAFMALFVMVLASNEAPGASHSKIAATFSRGLGLLALGAALVLSWCPDYATRAEILSRASRFAEAEATANRALDRAPLDWHIYFLRAGARACLGHNLEALADFRRARTLEPHYAGVPFEEGKFWLQTQPALALTVWREALRRVDSPEDEALYGAMLAAAPDDVEFRTGLFALAQERPSLQLQWFQFVSPTEARTQFDAISAVADRFTSTQRAAFQKRAAEIGVASTPQ
jgi:O-antigen ligase